MQIFDLAMRLNKLGVEIKDCLRIAKLISNLLEEVYKNDEIILENLEKIDNINSEVKLKVFSFIKKEMLLNKIASRGVF